MFCSNCGIQASGNFCAGCGTRLASPQPTPLPLQPQPEPPPPPQPPQGDWTNEIIYERLLQHPGVRERIVQAGKRSQPHMSGEQFLAIFDTVAPTGISLEKLAVALVPIYERMGIKTGKCSDMALSVPAGRALLATLCAMASQGYEITNVDQATDGLILTSTLPSTLWTNRGELVVSLQRSVHAIQIQASTKIPGQLMDWGKSTRLLRDLFGEIRSELVGPSSFGQPRGRDVA